MDIALLANLKQNAPTWPGMSLDQWDELHSWETVEAIAIALEKAGHRVVFLEGDGTLANNLAAVKPDICFNLCQGHFGHGRPAQVPAILEMLRLPYTGSRIFTLALDKPMTRRLLAYHRLPTPPFQIFEQVDEVLDPNLQFPLLVEPSRQEAAINSSAGSIAHDESQLQAQLQSIFERYRQPVLVEPFITGRTVMVGLVGNLAAPRARRIPADRGILPTSQGLSLFPPLEVDLAAYPVEAAGLYTDWRREDLARDFHCVCPAPLSESQVETLKWLAASAFRVIGCLDLARVNFRLDLNDDSKPYIMAINPLPGLHPLYSELSIGAATAGWRYEDLINRILDEAVERYQLTGPDRPPPINRPSDKLSSSLELV